MRPASLTVSNLGGSGIESFAAVINPPESAILAVGKVMPVVTVVDGQVAVQNRVNLTSRWTTASPAGNTPRSSSGPLCGSWSVLDSSSRSVAEPAVVDLDQESFARDVSWAMRMLTRVSGCIAVHLGDR